MYCIPVAQEGWGWSAAFERKAHRARDATAFSRKSVYLRFGLHYLCLRSSRTGFYFFSEYPLNYDEVTRHE